MPHISQTLIPSDGSLQAVSGNEIVSNFTSGWLGLIGLVVLLAVTVKYFVGGGRNIWAGIGVLMGAALCIALMAVPDKMGELGRSILELIGL